MSTIERLAAIFPNTAAAMMVGGLDITQAEAEYKAVVAERDALRERNAKLARALELIAYTQQDICWPPMMSEAESMRRKARAALAQGEANNG